MSNPRKHVLVLMCDQMRADRLGVVDPKAYTPNLDALCADGVHCSRSFSNHPQCSPARACLMTGLYSHEAGVLALKNFAGQRSTMTPGHPSMGKVFRDAGYRTAYFGKCHLELPKEDLGFEEGLITDNMQISDEEAEARGFGYVPPALRSDYHAWQMCMDWLGDYQDDGRDLFLFFSTNLPHPPFYTVPEFIERFPTEELQLPPSHGKETFEKKPAFLKKHQAGNHGSHDSDEQRRELAQYYSMIAETDKHFGDVMNAFKARGIWDDTIVLVIADHGDMMGGHNLRLKGTLPYDDILQIPTIWRFPGNEHAGSTCEQLVDQVHVPATLMRAAGVTVPDEFHHGDQLDLITGKAENDEPLFFEHYAAYWGKHPFIGQRSKAWKYLRYYGPDEEGFEELYDLKSDPDELHNVAAEPAHQELLSRLRQETLGWWQRTEGMDNDFYETDHFKDNSWNQKRFSVKA